MADNSFRQQLKSGVFYTALAKYSGIVVSLGVTAVLSRLLTPEDFGVIAVATVIIVFFSVFSDMGLSSAIVQKRNLTTEDYRSLFSYTVYTGIILAAIFFGASWIIADIYDDRQLIPICQILSAQILFQTWNIVPNGLLLHDKQFKFIGIRTFVIQLILAGISIGAAFLGLGVYTLLINPVGGALLGFILNYMKRPSKFVFNPTFISVKKVAGYSGYTFAFSLVNYFVRNLDKLLVGKVLGLNLLGYYEKSYRLMLLPVQNLTFVITPVLHPILADFQNNIKEQWNKYAKLLRILALVGFPLSAFLYFSANDLVLIIFGSQWVPSVPVFQILSLTCGIQIVGSTSGSFFMATNNTKLMFYLCVATSIIWIGLLFVGVYGIKTLEGVAWMFTVSGFFGLLTNIPVAKIVGITISDVYKPYLPALLPTAICAVALWPIYQFTDLSLVLGLIVKIGIFMAVLIPSLQLTKTFDVISACKNVLIRFHLLKLGV
ncbi:MAG: lipopolysaccharide biosynthesis protein [Muribaculaceae bacterium]|nr:lipopolysaccharide biosynthesis protein [Muribaculaceae bacterium]